MQQDLQESNSSYMERLSEKEAEIIRLSDQIVSQLHL